MAKPTILLTCFLCSRDFQFGPGRYDGRRVRSWQIDVCHSCEQGNHDGLSPAYEPKLLAQLRQHGLPEPQRRDDNRLIALPPRGA